MSASAPTGSGPRRLRCCGASGCRSAGGEALRQALEAAREAAGAAAEAVAIQPVGCLRLCGQGPLVACDGPEGSVLYGSLTPERAADLIAAASGVASTTTVSAPAASTDGTATDGSAAAPSEATRGGVSAAAGPGAAEPAPTPADAPLAAHRLDLDHPFFRLQRSVVLEGCGLVNPESIDDAIAHGTYAQLRRCLQERSPKEVRDEIRRSGLRGRGGAGYPTGLKWDTVALQPAGPRFVVCNADEGDPGAFMDRSVLESDPHRLIEGMAIAAFAVGADRGYVYVRAEYPLAIDRLRLALKQARRAGFLGRRVCGTGFQLELEVRVGAGAYVCGEETALLLSIQGQRGMPRPRPPFPAQSGLWGLPTLINNVETYTAVPAILREGGDWYAAMGTETSKGTKVFALSGAVRRTGLVEVPMGTSLRTVVEEMGGGVSDGTAVKAVQTGGPSGGCIPAERLDTPVDYESLQALGSMMGSGGMVVMGETTSMPVVARHFMHFSVNESCGKCLPCRAGTVQLEQLLDRFVERRAVPDDLRKLEALCAMVKATSLCGLGQAAPNPVLSTLRWFRHEYEAACRAPESCEPREACDLPGVTAPHGYQP